MTTAMTAVMTAAATSVTAAATSTPAAVPTPAMTAVARSGGEAGFTPTQGGECTE
jgi:hypothetical protein